MTPAGVRVAAPLRAACVAAAWPVGWAAVALALGVAGLVNDAPVPSGPCAPASASASSDPRAIDEALADGLRFLVAAQQPDGTWRSAHYPFLAGGPALTLPITKALLMAGSPTTDGAVKHALAALSRLVGDEGRLDLGDHGLVYPVYSAALALAILARVDDPAAPRARAAWLAYLRSFQLVEQLAWTPADRSYGGWGFARRPTRRGLSAGGHADLSSTLFAVGALRLAGVPSDDPTIVAAARFVERCQNFGPASQDGEPGSPDACSDSGLPDDATQDGGFFLSPTNASQNKAGPARPRNGRYHSYGSATSDGLRALLRCGYAVDHPRVVAARRWLETNFRADENPGDFPPGRELERAGSYYYWCWSFAHAMRALQLTELQMPEGPRPWAPALTSALLARRRSDGSFANNVTTLLEDDPLVATPFALAALALGRWFLDEAHPSGS